MRRCLLFERYEDELFQQISIMGLALRLAERSLNQGFKEEHLKMGRHAADKVDALLKEIRDAKEDCTGSACP